MATPRLALILLFLSSCSSIDIVSSSKIDVSMNEREEYTNEVELEVDKEFFLYGLVPSTHTLYIDEILKDAGVDSVSNLQVKKVRKTKNGLWALFTFGLYVPETYVIKAKTYRYRN